MTETTSFPPPSAPFSEPDEPRSLATTGAVPVDERTRWIRRGIDASVLALCVIFVLAPLHPGLLISDTTPAGGDMGAHVWAPAYLRDHLLPDLRLAGWTPAWYAGFPAFQFYMVIPSLLIVIVNSGVQGPLAVVPFAVSVGLGLSALTNMTGRRRAIAFVAAVLVAVFGIGVPYGAAFKVVTVSGLVAMPPAAYFLGRMMRFDFPGPAVMAVGTLPFLFDRSFTIYGGNIASTLAGEFAFSMSLSCALVYLGFVARGLGTGRYRAVSAGLLALTGLLHLIPAFFALGATAVLWLLRRPTVGGLRWLVVVGPVAGLLSAFWVLPFFWRRTYLNDMGWEKLAVWDEGQSFSEWWSEVAPLLLPEDMRWVFFLAIVGAILSIAFRIRLGVFLFVTGILIAVAFVLMPEGRLWNARILPFYYLCAGLLAAVGVTEVVRSAAILASVDPQRPHAWLQRATAPVSFALVAVVLGLPLGSLPFATKDAETGERQWAFMSTNDSSFIPSWSNWNYEGYEEKDAYPEYHAVVSTMEQVGRDRGCGRAMWEYQKELDRYGTPMALMLLPHWTDGCIDSMEGLYFEASSTTPYHFLVQSELSAAPSRAQRDLPYRQFDIDAGVDHLQLLGVRYYMATSTEAITAADTHPDLTEVARSGPWVVYEVAESELVEALELQPVVTDTGHAQSEWLCTELTVKDDPRASSDQPTCSGPALDWFQGDPDTQAVLSSAGPDAWQRVGRGPTEARPLEPVTVESIVTDTDRISFEVDEVGSPVLVKASYFPNWRATGAEGPYRVAPNLMLVVPTDTHVELTFGRTGVDLVAWLLTLGGLVALVVLARREVSSPAEG